MSRPSRQSKKAHKSHAYRSPSPVHSDSSSNELDQDDEGLPLRSVPLSPAQWSHHRHSTTSSINARLPPTSPLSPVPQEEARVRGSIEALPLELLIHIFRQITDIPVLYNCLFVSSTWCQCAVELLWLKPQITSVEVLAAFLRVVQPVLVTNEEEKNDVNGERTFDSNEVLVNGRWTSYESVQNNEITKEKEENKTIEAVTTPTPSQPEPLFPYPRFIRRLNLSSVGEELTDAQFRHLSSCIRIERLTLNGCVHLTDSGLSILSAMPNLVALDLTGVTEVTDNTILAVLHIAKRMQGLNLEGCKKITDVGVLAVAEQAPLLRRIKLCELDQVTNNSIIPLVQRCPLLIEIDLTGCIAIGDQAAREIWMHSAQLRELRLGGCIGLTDLAFPVPPRPAATAATAPNPISEHNQHIFLSLQPLVLSRPLTHLRQLDLMSLRISDEAVTGIVANAPRLRYLVLAKCGMLTDQGVRSISELGKQLQFLHLGHAATVTDEGIRKLCRSCTRLRYVDLACCTSLTNESVRALCALPKLRRIGLVRVPNLTDEAVDHLTLRANTLERVHLSYCERITVAAIHRLVMKLGRLTHLSLTGVPAFMRRELQRFCRSPPSNFNDLQRDAFCVYSGSGIHDLRKYLERNHHKYSTNSNIPPTPPHEDDDPFFNITNGDSHNASHSNDVQISESDDDNGDESTVVNHSSHQPQRDNQGRHPDSWSFNGIHEELAELARYHQQRATSNTTALPSMSRSQANIGTSRQPTSRAGSGLLTTPYGRLTPYTRSGSPSTSGSVTSATPSPGTQPYAGILPPLSLPNGTSNSNGGIRQRTNLSGAVHNPIVGALAQSRLQASSSSANTTSAELRWTPPSERVGHPLERSTRRAGAGSSAVSSSISSPGQRTNGTGGPAAGASNILPNTSGRQNGNTNENDSMTEECDEFGHAPSSPTAVASLSRKLKSSRFLSSTVGASTSRERSHTEPLLPSSYGRRYSESGSGRQTPTSFPLDYLNLTDRSGSSSPSPAKAMKKSLKGTLSAAEQFTVSLFRKSGRRDGNESPGPAGHGAGKGEGVSASPR